MPIYRTDSLYRDTKITGQYLDVLDINNIDVVNTTTTDIIIEEKYDEKPDLLAHDLYGNAKLWWAFALFNQDKFTPSNESLKLNSCSAFYSFYDIDYLRKRLVDTFNCKIEISNPDTHTVTFEVSK